MHFEICHYGTIAIMQVWTRLPRPTLCARRQHRVLAAINNALRSKLGALRTGGVRKWGRNRAVKTNWLVLSCLSVCNVGFPFLGFFSATLPLLWSSYEMQE